MNKIEEILLEEYKDHSFARIIIKNTHLQNAMKQFGKICFEAARKYHLHNTYEFDHYEDFLKEIEDENN